MNPLDEIEAHLVNASNALNELVYERRKGRPESSRRQELNERIDAALRIVQAWSEEEKGEDGDHDLDDARTDMGSEGENK